MSRAKKPPRVVWVTVNAEGNATTASNTERLAGVIAFMRETVHRYRLDEPKKGARK